MRLLVVEDDDDAAAFVLDGLRSHGHEADVAANGRQGLALAIAGNTIVVPAGGLKSGTRGGSPQIVAYRLS